MKLITHIVIGLIAVALVFVVIAIVMNPSLVYGSTPAPTYFDSS